MPPTSVETTGFAAVETQGATRSQPEAEERRVAVSCQVNHQVKIFPAQDRPQAQKPFYPLVPVLEIRD